jgi:hypothetical protein
MEINGSLSFRDLYIIRFLLARTALHGLAGRSGVRNTFVRPRSDIDLVGRVLLGPEADVHFASAELVCEWRVR